MNYTVNTVFLSGENHTNTSTTVETLQPLEFNYFTSTGLKMKNSLMVYNDGFKLYSNKLLNNLKDATATNNTIFYLTSGVTWDEFIYDGYNSKVSNLNNQTKVLFDRLNNTGFFYAFIQDRFASNPLSFVYLSDITPTEDPELSTSETQRSLAKFTRLTNGKVKISFTKQQRLATVNPNVEYETIEFVLTVDVSTHNPVVKIVRSNVKLPQYVQEFNLYLVEDLMLISFDTDALSNYSASDINIIGQENILSESSVIQRFIGVVNSKLVANGIMRGLAGSIDNLNKYINNINNINVYKTSAFALVNDGYTDLELGIANNKHNVWVGYYNEIYDKANNQNVKPNPNLTVEKVPVNYLVTSNFKSQVDAKNNTIKVNILPLKTTYTPEQETIKTTTVNIEGVTIQNAPENIQPVQRTYTKLFVTNNEMENYSKINLGYTSFTNEIKLKADQDNYFHYPLQADRIPLSSSDLIQAGALPGATPFLSDKIFMKNAAYGDKSYWGHLTPPPGCLNGQFLCSWLSGSDASSLSGLEQSIWMDRWYDSAKVTEISALFASTNAISSTLNGAIIYDTPSQMVLNPGGWYYYFHVGNEIIKDFVNSFNIGNTSLRLNVQCTTSKITDESFYDNNIFITNEKDSTITLSNPDGALEDNYVLNLDGTNYATIQFKDNLDVTDDITVGMWMNSDKWLNNPGHYLLDNSFRGGWSYSINNGFYNPTISIGESYYGHVLDFADSLRPYTDNLLISGTSLQSSITGKLNPDNVIVTDEFYTYAFDKQTKTLCKFEYTGNLVKLIDISSYSPTISNSKILLGPDEWIYVHFNNSIFKTDTDLLSTVSLYNNNFPYNNFILDLSGNVVGGDFVDIAVDNFNTIWYISSCPPSFFTSYIQPGLERPFFDITTYDLTNMVASLTAAGDLNFVFYFTSTNGISSAEPIRVLTLEGNDITFPVFFKNNATNAILSKFYQPTRLNFDNNNYLYMLNNRDELIKLIIGQDHQAGYVSYSSLINKELTTGLNLTTIAPYITSNFLGRTNAANRNSPVYEYIKLTETETTWDQVKSSFTKQNYLNFMYEYDEITETYRTFIYYINNYNGVLYKFSPEGEYINTYKIAEGFDILTAPTIDNNKTNYNNIATSYDWSRKYISNKGNYASLDLKIYTIINNQVTKHTLRTSNKAIIDNEWHHVAFTYDASAGQITLYLDGVIVDTKSITPNSKIYYKYKNDIGIGTTILKTGSLLTELKSSSYLFYGKIDDIRIYDHVLTRGNIGRLIINKYKIHDMIWNIQTGTKSYIEEIRHFFKNKTPGSKSAVFNLYISNSGITDQTVKQGIEQIIRESMPRISPSYTRLNKIYWT